MTDFEKLVDNIWAYIPVLMAMCLVGFGLGLLIGTVL